MLDIRERGRELDLVLERALDEARQDKADEIKINASLNEEKRLVMENGAFSLANSSMSQSIGITVHHNQRKGSSSTNTVSSASMREAIREARELASFSIPDPFLSFVGTDQATAAAPLPFLFDDALPRLELRQLKETMKAAAAILTADKRLVLERFEVEVDASRLSLMNHLGVRQNETQSTLQWSFVGIARDDEDVSGMDYDSGFSFALAGAEELLLQQAREFRDKALRNLNPVPCPSYKGAIIISPRAFEEILLETILYHAGGWQIMDGKSRWEKMLGKQVTHPLLTLQDRPRDPLLMGATSYDEDGVPTRDYDLIAGGVLRTHLQDAYTAKKLKTVVNGTAGGPFSLHVGAGATPMAALFKLAPVILCVDRFSGNLDPLTGDFSGVAKSSHVYRNGADEGCVTETMIAGNVFELLKNVVAISVERENVAGQILCPHVAVDGVTVSGEPQ